MKPIHFNIYIRQLMVIAGILIISFFVNAQSITQQPGYQHFTVGKIAVTALSDGTVPVNAKELLHAKEPGRVSALVHREYLIDPVEVSINTYLVQLADKLVLIDAGVGALFGSEHGGKLIANLKAAGFNADQVTDVLITHIHLDHSGGLSLNNVMQFNNAIVHINGKELDFWMKHQKPQKGESRGISDNRPAFEAIKPYLVAGKVATFEGDTKLFDGIHTKEVIGHTPGHTVFLLESEKEKLLFWGDLIHIAAVQLHGPEIENNFDFDKEKAAIQRQAAYTEAAKEGYMVAADHISFPGIGRVTKDGKGYRWISLPYTLLGRTR